MSKRNIRATLTAGIYLVVNVVFCTATIAQSNLTAIDKAAEKLLSTTDENKYEYDRVQWTIDALHAVEKATIQELDSFCPQTLGKLSIPRINTTILYYLRPEGNQATLCWVAKRIDEKKQQTNIFTDVITGITNGAQMRSMDDDDVDAQGQLRPSYSRHMVGFEITDTVTGHRIWWMPDIRIRMDMETMADIEATDADKEHAQDVVQRRLHSLLGNDDGLSADLSGLPRLYCITSSNGRMRIVTYMNAFGDLTNRCGGLVLKRNLNGSIDMFDLDDCTAEINNPERLKTTSEKWFGAVYYDMVEVNYDKTVYYTLFGYKGSDGITKTRVIEPMWFDGKKCRFGAPIFEHEKATYTRRVFRYSAGVNMMMRWDEKKKSIVFDHLSPLNSMYIGEYRFYGPDFSYDGYEKGSKYWKFKEDIELRNE